MTPVHTARSYWIICLLLLPAAIFSAFDRPWVQTADMWETAAAIRAASVNPFHPSNPLLPLPGDTSPRFVPYVIFWGAVGHATGWGVFTVVGLAGVVNFLLFVSGLARWITLQFKDPRVAPVLLVVMLTVWGTGYAYANGYEFGHFLDTLSLVGMFVYGVSFHALAFLRRYLDQSRWGSLLAYALLSVLAFVTHPITAAFLFVAAGAMLLSEGNLKRTLLFQIVPLVAVGLAMFWPYFSYWQVITDGSTENWFPHTLFSGQIPAMGAALLGIPLAIYYYRKRRYMAAVLGAFFCLAIYALCGATRIFIGNRFILYGAIFLHLLIALYLLENRPQWWKNISLRQPRSLFKLAMVLVLFVPALYFRGGEVIRLTRDVAHRALGSNHPETTSDRFSFLSGQLTPSDIVLAEDDTGWPVPAISGARLVSQQKGNPLIESEVERRRADARKFFLESLSIEQRRELLKRYKVTHIVLDMWHRDTWDSMLFQQLTQIAREQIVQNKIAVYRVLPS